MPAGTQGGDSSPIVQLPPISNTSTVAIVGDIDITNDTKKVITKMKQNSQLIFLNGDFWYSEDGRMTLDMIAHSYPSTLMPFYSTIQYCVN